MLANDGELADYFSALANASRLSVLRRLANGEIPAKELATSVGLSQSALSHHLNVLKRQQVVKARREAQTIYYSLASDRSEKAVSLLNGILFPDGLQMSMFGFPDFSPEAA
ncbi:ArsR/SmtB family transcription factor [Rhizobium ruizarguesonis]|jgi:DNA-binding transcriptional ArsR family regulator|uniref:ArsR/SmtB family transcription factor n=1 Tax=Rhizobium ruizarguesonis TaxID=2081791 RepID=UPI0009496F10|nr:metalloregulator ArsR/SmtB family transcription factor [Rhizobium ruizarguesonis]TAV08069.1 ArsR family transcriptional regulator [Rhizobium ruizarguesonis]TAZ97374.1 ArsR family transcriptional regulator [Rhizobium ruizarguesonis]TBA40260.1 ArsR family transcriptional regulator [Rhizobium ruizarguesonis]TBA83003.1 ArsR family transcriptional regulator [Rhizobium ruizarguesonis]TBA87802.1 ArsR family transcriptional regulator [Rhizobium ruizarguesonis]